MLAPVCAPYLREKTFFRAFDQLTTPERRMPPALQAAVRTLLPFLKSRIRARLERPARLAKTNFPQSVQLLSQAQLTLFRASFPDAKGPAGVDLRALSFALLLFANSSLHDADYSEHGQPNGPAIFCFAEFAFVAQETSADTLFWRAMTPALVRMQTVYMRAYHPTPDAPRPHSWDDWGGSFQRPSGQRFSDRQLVRMIARPLVNPGARATANARAAFTWISG